MFDLTQLTDLESRQLAAGFSIVGVYSANQTRIKRPGQDPHLHRVGRFGDRGADKRLFHRTVDALGILRANIPSGRRDDLVVLNLSVFDYDPIGQRSASPRCSKNIGVRARVRQGVC